MTGHRCLALANLGQLYVRLGKKEEGLALLLEAESLAEMGRDPLLVPQIRVGLAIAYNALGRNREGAAILKQVVDDFRRATGDDHPKLVIFELNYALASAGIGDIEEGLAAVDRAEQIVAATFPPDHRMHASAPRVRITLWAAAQRWDLVATEGARIPDPPGGGDRAR